MNEAFDVFMSIKVEVAKTKQEAVALTKQLVTYRRDINTLAKQNLRGTYTTECSGKT